MKNGKYIILGLLMTLALNISARTFRTGEELYVNMQQSFDWTSDGAILYLYLFDNNGHNTWLNLTQENGKLYKGTVSSQKDYTTAIVVRKNPSNPAKQFDGDVWNQTEDMNIPDDWNCIDKFDDAAHRWAMYSPQTSKINAYVSVLTADEIHICPSALGCIIALRPKLNADTTSYIYDQVTGQEWYVSSNGGSTWSSINSHAGATRSENNIEEKDLFTNLPNTLPAGGIYYYLHSSIPAGRHLIRVQDDAPDCALNCEITAFETAVSNVNADDNTYTLDGMVAFGQANGNLVISCDGKSITISDPKSPQAFSLHGVPAATVSGLTTTATAYFVGDQTNCSKAITIDVPNATEAVAVVNVDSLTGRGFVLTPKDYDPANNYVWLANGDTVKGAPQVLVIDPYSKDSTTTYTYKEYYPASGSMDDIMENGDYEDETWNYNTKKVSEYDYWGLFPQTATTQINFYRDTLPGGVNYPAKYTSNGFSVVRNANNFYPTYAKVTAKSGNNFGLFDAATGTAGANKMAWYATTADNSKLKLQKGTTYVLSFWAANINNYGEMDNAAKFKFYIEDITNPANPVKIDSSEVLDLSKQEYRNNLWHQCSKTILAKNDYNNVRISVVNLNNRALNIGNDFALDDIQFHPISTVSKVVKSQQQFVVTAHQPKITAFTATPQPIGCGGTSFVVKMHVEYENPDGQLIIKDATDNIEYPYTVSAPFDTPQTLDKDIILNIPTADLHNWEVFWENTPSISRTTTTNSPVVPLIDTAKIAFSELSCTDQTTTLTFDLDYTYQRGTLTYWVDALPKQTASYSVDDPTKQTLTGLTVPNIPADGRAHKLYVSFSGANSCFKSYTLPYAPKTSVISSFVVTKNTETVLCDEDSFTVTITATIPYALYGTAFFTLPIPGGPTITSHIAGQGKTSFTYKDIKVPMCDTAMVFTLRIMEISGMHACPVSDTIDMPTRMSCSKLDTTICEGNTVSWMGDTYPTTPYIGTDTFTSGYDSLILTIKALPRITVGTVSMVCDSANEVRIPYTVTTGSPDTYDIAVDGSHYAGTVSGSDLVFSPTTMVAGDYTATLTVSETGMDCESTATTSFTIALSGHLYSKWTDVLFISNADGKFVSYQWFADGVAMPGETMQRLYDPDGLAGTTTLYQCRMNTTDGKIIYTCPQTFDDAIPSRSENTGSAVQTKKIYDTMGRPINGTPSRGIYIVVMEIDGEQVTTKMLIHD